MLWKSNLSSYLSYLLTEAVWGVLSYFDVLTGLIIMVPIHWVAIKIKLLGLQKDLNVYYSKTNVQTLNLVL